MSNKYKFKLIGIKDGDVCWEITDTKLNNRWRGTACIDDVRCNLDVEMSIKLLNQRNLPYRPYSLLKYHLNKLVNQAVKDQSL